MFCCCCFVVVVECCLLSILFIIISLLSYFGSHEKIKTSWIASGNNGMVLFPQFLPQEHKSEVSKNRVDSIRLLNPCLTRAKMLFRIRDHFNFIFFSSLRLIFIYTCQKERELFHLSKYGARAKKNCSKYKQTSKSKVSL